tara:strand:- start:5375 stop:5581 length:207 start_codon:yes stop_codon:yes gene_type:complete
MPKSRVGSASNNSVTTSGTSSGVGKKGSLRNVISRRVQKVTCKNGKNCGNNVCGGSFKANAACGRFRW